MRNTEFLVPHVKVSVQNWGEETYSTIGSTLESLTDSGYGENKIMGINDTSLKFGPGFVTCKLSFPIHQSILHSVNFEGQNNELSRMFDFSNYWQIDYGWAGDNYKISKMKMFDLSIDYNQEIKTFIVNMDLVPAPIYVLADIKLSMLDSVMLELRDIFDDNSVTEYSGDEWGHPKSIGSVITRLLFGCRELIREDKITRTMETSIDNNVSNFEEYQAWLTNRESTNCSIPPNNRDERFFDPSKKDECVMGSMEGTSLDDAIKKYPDLIHSTYVSNRAILAREDDIPHPKDIRLVLFESNDTDGITIDDVARNFNDAEMPIMNSIQKIGDTKYLDTSVMSFITQILEDNNFDLYPMPHTIDKRGRINWMIIQTNINNLGLGLDEEEYVGINTIDKPKAIPGLDKFVNTFAQPGTKQSQLFDLHSNRNVIISINASTQAGRSTYATATAAEAIAEGNKPSTDNKMKHDFSVPFSAQTNSGSQEPIDHYRNSMFAFLSKQSHELNMDIIGSPDIKIGDNIHVNLGGKLFTGKYKIIELEHKLSDSFITTLRAMRIVKLEKLNSNKDQQKDVAIQLLSEDVIEDTDSSAVEKISRSQDLQNRSGFIRH